MKRSHKIMIGMSMLALFGATVIRQPNRSESYIAIVKTVAADIQKPLKRGLREIQGFRIVKKSAGTGCGGLHVLLVEGYCDPINPSTGMVYSEELLKYYKNLADNVFVSRGNIFVPQRLSVREAEAQNAEIAQMNELRDRIKGRIASESEIEDFYHYRERVFAQKLQIIHALYIESGGVLSTYDPVLNRDLIQDEEVRKIYDQFLKDEAMDYEQHKFARKDNGLKAEDFLF